MSPIKRGLFLLGESKVLQNAIASATRATAEDNETGGLESSRLELERTPKSIVVSHGASTRTILKQKEGDALIVNDTSNSTLEA